MRSRTLGAVCATCAVAVPVSEAQALTPAPPPSGGLVAGAPPVDLAHVDMIALIKRYLRLEAHRQSLSGQRLGMGERDRLGATMRTHTPEQLRAETRALRHKVRKLRSAARRRTGGAPDIPIPAALKAIAQCESHSNPRAIDASGTYRGKYQFDYGTWASVGGKGDPAAASATEQDRRAAMLYKRSGATPWPVCGR
ncbi:MAG: resuscitation-promoting factor RpfE [Solirubrobacteraceae bacterium]|nr:resuscitation-promoting factor RpfE [Solirubrobacteraceae bacterium]